MADNKRTRSRTRRKRAGFSEVKGKVVEGVELLPSGDGYSIGIMFQDRTYLSFEVKPHISIFPELSDWKSENYKPLKHWRTLHS